MWYLNIRQSSKYEFKIIESDVHNLVRKHFFYNGKPNVSSHEVDVTSNKIMEFIKKKYGNYENFRRHFDNNYLYNPLKKEVKLYFADHKSK